MSDIYAKPIIDEKLRVIEQSGEKIATLRKKENSNFVLSTATGELMFDKKEDLMDQFGSAFFLSSLPAPPPELNECYGYPTSYKPFNPMYDVRRKLPLFTKSSESRSLYCAGYYAIKFNKEWVRSFCPKAVTIERYPFKGPFMNDSDLKATLTVLKAT